MIICPWKDIKKYASLLPGIEEAIDAVNALTEFTPGSYPLSNGNRYVVSVDRTVHASEKFLETHREFLDVQIVCKGEELVGWAPLEELTMNGEFDAAADVAFYNGTAEFFRMREGMCYVLFPEDGHMPTVHLDHPTDFVKVIVKLKA